jgi:hypothetical protein
MYTQGIRSYYAGDFRSALRLFDDALAEDSLFALAAYCGALAASVAEPATWLKRLEHARNWRNALRSENASQLQRTGPTARLP